VGVLIFLCLTVLPSVLVVLGYWWGRIDGWLAAERRRKRGS
jgi:hypothetical protein